MLISTRNAAYIEQHLRELADEFSPPGRETILGENLGKHVHETALILGHLPPGGRILDLGGGDSINLILLDRLGVQADMVVIDNFVAASTNRMGNEGRPLPVTQKAGISVVNQDFWESPRLPFPAGFFDVVCIFDVLEHLPGSPMAVLEEVYRIMKPAGKLIVSGPNAIALMRRVELLLGEHPYMPFELWVNPGYVSHFREYTPREYRTVVERAGFSVQTCELVLEPTRTRAHNRYHNRKRSWLSPVSWALWGLYVVEWLRPSLRPVVTIVAFPKSRDRGR